MRLKIICRKSFSTWVDAQLIMKPVRKVENPRSTKIPMMTTGTAHSGNAWWDANPLSSRVLNTAGSIGSVWAVSIMPTKPSASRRLYGPNKRSTRSKLAGNFIKICYVFPLRHDEESSTLPFLRICGAGESIRLRRSMRQVQRDAFTRQSWAEPYDARPEDMPGEIIFHYN